MRSSYDMEKKLLAAALQSSPPAPASQRIVLPVPPSTNKLWYHEYRNGRISRHRTQEYRNYKRTVLKLCVEQKVQCHRHTERICVAVNVYRREGFGDLDNSFKALLDSLNGVAWVDDDQIRELHGYWHDDGTNPRVVVYVTVAQIEEQDA